MPPSSASSCFCHLWHLRTDQHTGRWTQEDPLGVAGGLNLYQFNGNDPVAYTDPFGLKPCSDIRKEIRRKVSSMQRRVTQYLDAWRQGDADQDHLNQLNNDREGFGNSMKEYGDNNCYDDDDHDGFRDVINKGDALQHAQLPAPQLLKNPKKHPRLPVPQASELSIPAPTPTQVGAMSVLMMIAAILLSPVGM